MSNEKNNNNIGFTTKDIIDLSIRNIIKYKDNIKIILEPSCGSCQFIKNIDKHFNNVNINCIEYSIKIYDSIKNIESINNNKFNIINDNYLNYNDDILYDLIIGYPPYYIVKKDVIDLLYKDYYDGKANLFILFIIHSLKKLNKDGILCFILPKKFMTCLYYDKLRNNIYNNFKIINIIDCSNNKSIKQNHDTIIFIISNSNKNEDNYKFSLNINNYIIFNTEENIIKLKELYKNSKTLNELNFKVTVGPISWNDVKEILTNDITKTKLIYVKDSKNHNMFETIERLSA
jgi:hypothetical protein